MEWRQQTSFSCAEAFSEAQRWIEGVTGKAFGCSNFRAALENGVLLCDLINQLKPGIIKRLNRFSTPIAGLDNVNVFLKACGKLGLNESQLFHPGDLQDLSTRVNLRRDESNRRLKNVLITIYWLGRKAHLDAFYSGPQLNFKAFEGLLGLALSKALDQTLDEGSSAFVKDGPYPEREEFRQRQSYKRENSVESVESLDERTPRLNCEGCGSDAEAEQVFRMEINQQPTQQSRGHIPPPLLRRKQGRQVWDSGCSSPFSSSRNPLPPLQPQLPPPSPEWTVEEKLLLQALCEEDSDSDDAEADPVLDDLYVRRVQQTLHQTSVNLNHDRFLPRFWTPEEEVRVRTIYLGSQTRPWYREMQRLRTSQVQVTSERKCRVNPGWIWSKSLSDIPMVYPVRNISEGNTLLNSGQSQAKDSEAQWQDDLTKWKNRRRSTKSDPRRKSFDREHVINQMANGAVSDAEKKEAAGGRIKSSPRDQLSPRRHDPAPQSYAAPPPSKPPSTHPRPHTRALLARSFATEVLPGGSMPASDGIILGEETHLASLPSNGAGATTPSPDCTFSSQTSIKAQCGPSPLQPAVAPLQPDKCVADQTSPATALQTKLASDQPAAVTALKETPSCVEAKVPAGNTDAPADGSHQEGSQKTAQEAAAEPVGGQQAASSHKYLSGSGPWSSASLPRGYRRSEGSSRLSSVITARPFGSKQSRVSSLPRLFNVDDNLGLLAAAEKESPLSPADSSLLKRQSTTALPRVQSQASIRLNKADLAQRAVSEQQQEGRGASLSGQTNGYHHHPEAKTQLPAKQQTCKSLTMPSNGSTELPMVDYSDMRVSLTLKPNSRPDFGFQTNWDSTGARLKYIEPGSPAELCRLCVDDEIVAVDGVAVARMSYSQWESKMTSALRSGSLTMDMRRYGDKGVPDHNFNGDASPQTTVFKVNGKADDVTQVKVFDGELGDSHSTAVSKGGSESAISNLQVPSLSPSSSSWSWDHEEERRRQEKWQEEQERLLQEQYQRDQQRLEAEWQRAQHDAMLEENTFEKSSGGGGIPARAPHVNGLANKLREEQSTDGEQKETEAGSKPATSPSVAHVVHDDKITEQDWAEGNFPQLSPAHRAKSLSTPALGGPHKQLRADQRKRKGECVSKAEQERKQILEEMKKRTHLLTDNSWIRQRSSSLYKEPVYTGVPLKRYESLDNLDILRQSPLSTHTFSHPRPHSAAAGYFGPSRSASRLSAGPVLSQRNTPTDPNHGRTLSGRRTCCVCERDLSSGAAMLIEALGLCFHLACFQCVGCRRHLRGAETGVQVRVRNRRLYCEPCYLQLKCAPSM